MHKNTRLFPYMRKAMYVQWVEGKSVSSLGREYKVTRKIVYRVVERGKLGEFENRKSVNKRFRTIEYGLKRLSIAEEKLQKKITRSCHKLPKIHDSIPLFEKLIVKEPYYFLFSLKCPFPNTRRGFPNSNAPSCKKKSSHYGTIRKEFKIIS